MSDTPETDAMGGYISDWITFAQKLERERNALKKKFVEEKFRTIDALAKLAKARDIADKAINLASSLGASGMDEWDDLCAELNQLEGKK